MHIHFKLNKELDKRLIAKFLTVKEAGVDFGKSILKYHPALESVVLLPRAKNMFNVIVSRPLPIDSDSDGLPDSCDPCTCNRSCMTINSQVYLDKINKDNALKEIVNSLDIVDNSDNDRDSVPFRCDLDDMDKTKKWIEPCKEQIAAQQRGAISLLHCQID